MMLFASTRCDRWRSRIVVRGDSMRRRAAGMGGLRAILLREAFDAAFGVDQLLPSGEERMAVRADFQVQIGLGRARLPCRAARAPDFDFVVFRVNSFPHSELLTLGSKLPL